MSSLTAPPRAIFRQIQANLANRYGSGFPVFNARSGQVPRLWRPMLAMDGRPGNGSPGGPGYGGPGDHNGRSGARMAGDGGPGNPSDDNGRSVALSEGGGEFRVAGGKVTGSEFHAGAARAGDTGKNVASTTARSGQIPRLWHPVLADNGSAGGDNGGSTEGGRGGISGDV
jgi:hypothetical protein